MLDQVERRVERPAFRVFQRFLEGRAVVTLDVTETPGLTLVRPVLGAEGVGSLEVRESVGRMAVQREVCAQMKLCSRGYVIRVECRPARADPLLVHQVLALG